MHLFNERFLLPRGTARTAVWVCAGIALFVSSARATAQPRTLRLDEFQAGGVRQTVTDSWGICQFGVTNLSDQDRHGRMLMFYKGRPEVQYGRDVWVPAQSRIKSWMLVGPPSVEHPPDSCEIYVLLYDHSEGKPRLIQTLNEDQIMTRGLLFKKREPYTAILLDKELANDADESDTGVPGELPQPRSLESEALQFARVARASNAWSEFVHPVPQGALPVSAEALDGCDQFVIASNRIANDPAGMEALRRWLQRGGDQGRPPRRVWVMLDTIDPEILAPLLGDRLDFQLVDRVGLTETKIEAQALRQSVPEAPVQEHEKPVALARVLLPPGERAALTVNGWPAMFTRQVGRGKVLFTTLGARAWHRPRTTTDPRSPYEQYSTLPMATTPLDALAKELQAPVDEQTFDFEALRPLLASEIGYSVIDRRTVLLVFGGAALVALVLGIGLRKSRRPELLGWLGPLAALGAAAAFLVLSEWSQRAAPATVAMAQIVDADTGVAEAPVRGLLALYRPEPGLVEAGVRHGGFFDLDMAGIEGQNRALMSTDLDAWHWESLSLPKSVRFAPFHSTIRTGEPIHAVARFGPDGLQGELTLGDLAAVSDAVLATPNGRNLSLRVAADGAFRAGGQDALPIGQYLSGGVLSDLQQRRQEVYREFLKRPANARTVPSTALLAWTEPRDLQFNLEPGARTAGSALLVVPLRMERPRPGERLTIPGSLIPFRQMLKTGPIPPTVASTKASNMLLRFQLPSSALPITVESARLTVKMNAPSRRVTISGWADERAVELLHVESPLDPIRVDLKEERFLHLDDQGGLHVNLNVSDPANATGLAAEIVQVEEQWTIEFIELEVVGKTKDVD
jgi:hypothetical protein